MRLCYEDERRPLLMLPVVVASALALASCGGMIDLASVDREEARQACDALFDAGAADADAHDTE